MRYRHTLIMVIFLAIPIVPISADLPANYVYELIHDGTGFENATWSEDLRFDNFTEQENFFSSYNYPDFFQYESGIYFGRDAENKVLWFSVRPEIRYGNRTSWPSNITDELIEPSIDDRGNPVWQEDYNNKNYFLSTPVQVRIYLSFENSFARHLLYYTDPNACDGVNWQNDMNPCAVEEGSYPNSFPLVQNQSKYGYSLLEGFDSSITYRNDHLRKVFPTGDQSIDNVDIAETGTFGCNYGTAYHKPQTSENTWIRIDLLMDKDHDNFGIKYEVTRHPAEVHIGGFARYYNTNPTEYLGWCGNQYPPEDWPDYDAAGRPMNYTYERMNSQYLNLHNRYLGPQKETIGRINEIPEDNIMSLSIDLPLTTGELHQPIIPPNQNYIPDVYQPIEFNYYGQPVAEPSSIPEPSAQTVQVLSGAALLASSILLTYKTYEELLPQEVANRLRKTSKRKSNNIISDAIEQNKVR